MRRLSLAPRADWRARADTLGFSFHTIDGAPYWDETAAYEFTAAEIDSIEAASAEIEARVLQAVERIISERSYQPFGLSDRAVELIERSWQRQERNLYGRFDLSYREGEPPKLLEYNADTPTALFEASVIQWEWLQTLYPDADQFNSIHEKLIDAWRRFGLQGPLHLTCVRDHAEDKGTIDYIRDTAIQAGLATEFLHIDEIGWNGQAFVDMADRPIETLFKLYPWEWLLEEPFARHLGATQLIEPAWKMLLSNKAVLAVLWDMFPDHPNLLPASLREGDIEGDVVAKPLLGREGANVTVTGAAGHIASEGGYGAEGFVYQAYAPLPEFDGRFPVIGSWMIASEPAGIGIREDQSPITRNTSQFVPHLFR